LYIIVRGKGNTIKTKRKTKKENKKGKQKKKTKKKKWLISIFYFSGLE
jgi:hypothetical protein